MLFYGTINFLKFANKEDYNVVTSLQENYFPANSTFGLNEGFYVGAALAAYDDVNQTSLEDPTIATLEFFIKEYDYVSTGINFR